MQKQRRDDEGYIKVTVVLMLDTGWGAGQVAQALGLDDGTKCYCVAPVQGDVYLGFWL